MKLKDEYEHSHNKRMISKLDTEESLQKRMWAEWENFITERRCCTDVILYNYNLPISNLTFLVLCKNLNNLFQYKCNICNKTDLTQSDRFNSYTYSSVFLYLLPYCIFPHYTLFHYPLPHYPLIPL